MDILILNFIDDNYTEEMGAELLKSFLLFEEYQLAEYELQYLDLLLSQDLYEPTEIASQFIKITKDKIKYIIELQGIKLTDEVAITELNKIADALYTLQNSADLYFIEDAIYSEYMNPMESICEVIVNLVNIEKSTLYTAISYVDPNTIDRIKEILSVLDEKQSVTSQKDQVTIYDIFERLVDKDLTVDGGDLLGRRIIDSGFTLGLSFNSYMNIVGDMEYGVDMYSANIFSIYILSEDFKNGNIDNLLEYIKANNANDQEEIITNVIQLQSLLEKS